MYFKKNTSDPERLRLPNQGVEKPGFVRQPGYQPMTLATGQEQAAEPAPVPEVDTQAPTQEAAAPGWQSDAVTQAQQMLEEFQANKPGAYQSQWQAQMDEIMDQILNRGGFSYDVNADAMYQQYADLYRQQGRQAMLDTTGQMAAMTGGYGNSFAQNAGQQAYQGYLQQLNGMIPEFYQMALDRYQMEGDRLADQFAMLGAREDQDYARYQDDMDQYYAELERLLGQYYAERDFAYEQNRDQIGDEQWQQEFDEDKRRYDQEWQYAIGEYTGNGGSGGNDAPVEDVPVEDVPSELSEAGQNFMQQLPYLQAGGDVEGWKRTVAGRLYRALESGVLSEDDAFLIAMQLGLEDIEPDHVEPTEQDKKEVDKKKKNGGGGGGGKRPEMISWG